MEVLKVCGKSLEVAVLEKRAQAQLDAGSISQRIVTGAAFTKRRRDRIALLVVRAQLCYCGIAGRVHVLDQIANGVVVDRIAKARLCAHFVAFGDRDIPHVVGKARELRSLPVVPCRATRIHPPMRSCTSGSDQ